MYSKDVIKVIKRLQSARLALMKKQPFYAVLLLHMQFSLDPNCETVYTDGIRIAFCPNFLESITDRELEFVLMHQVLHAALNHSERLQESFSFDEFSTACDIVVNSNILHSCNNDTSFITINGFGESIHLAPDGTEGYKHTVEEVYQMILAQRRKEAKKKRSKYIEDDETEDSEKEPGICGRWDGGFDDHTFWGDRDAGRSESGSRQGDETGDDPEPENGDSQSAGSLGNDQRGFDYHKYEWQQRLLEAAQMAEQICIRQGNRSRGRIPAAAQRLIKELTKAQTDWREVLDSFIQEEVTDYSFCPPDRRFQDSPFLLPDYNEKEDRVKDLLFMIDTSGSMSDDMITQAYSEVYGALQQFDGRLEGWLGFFDAEVVKPKKFTDETELKIIRPKGGGGTSFECIFRYVAEHLDSMEPSNIVILTDGFAPFPNEGAALGIPVLWLINNLEVEPPWGKVARIDIPNKEQIS